MSELGDPPVTDTLIERLEKDTVREMKWGETGPPGATYSGYIGDVLRLKTTEELIAERREAATALRDTTARAERAEGGWSETQYAVNALAAERDSLANQLEAVREDWLRTYNAYLQLFNTLGTLRKWLEDGGHDIPDETIKSFRQRVDIEAGYLSAQCHVSEILGRSGGD